MNEEATTVAPAEGADTSTGESAETGSTTAEEVAQVLNIPVDRLSNEAQAEEIDETETDETATEEVQTEATEETQLEAPEVEEAQEETTLSDTPNFNVEVEDANGNKLVIEPGANLEEALGDFVPKNNGQIVQIIKEAIQKEGEQAAWEAQQQEETQKAEYAERVATVQAGWDKEISKLQGEKRLPADGKIEDRKGEVYSFIAQENAERAKDGRPFIQSFEDALDKLELKESRAAAVQQAKDAKEAARKNGGLVGGSSAPASNGGGAYVAGSARTADEALRQAGLLR